MYALVVEVDEFVLMRAEDLVNVVIVLYNVRSHTEIAQVKQRVDGHEAGEEVYSRRGPHYNRGLDWGKA